MSDRIKAQISAIDAGVSELKVVTAIGLAPLLLSIASLRFLAEIESVFIKVALTSVFLLLAVPTVLCFITRMDLQGSLANLHFALVNSDFDENKCLDETANKIINIKRRFASFVPWIVVPLAFAYFVLVIVLLFVIWTV